MEARSLNPCVQCGACCAFFRVEFPSTEIQQRIHFVPKEHFDTITDVTNCMRGTNKKHRPACTALKGRIGKDAHCSIYSLRPSPCRRFSASYSNGKQNRRCDEARRAHGLPPLRPADWKFIK